MTNLIASIAARSALARQGGAAPGAEGGAQGAVPAAPSGKITLAIDVGGTRLKAGLLDAAGVLIGGPVRVNTPHPAPPSEVVDVLVTLVGSLPADAAGGTARFDRISVGFPGVVRQGRVRTAPNLGNEAWAGFDLSTALATRLGREVRVLNDARVQGLGVIAGVGLECVLTFGTGMGFALFTDGQLAPHLEMGQHICRKRLSYDHYIGNAALKEIGDKRWNRRAQKVIDAINELVNYDTLLIGGGNARKITFPLPPHVRIVSNEAGITGGVRLWDPTLHGALA